MKEEIYPIIGRRIQTIRKDHNCSQQELAEILDLSRTSVSNIENGRHPIFLHHIYTISEKFNLPLEKLLPSVSDILTEEQSKDDDLKNSILQEGITDERTISNIVSAINKSEL